MNDIDMTRYYLDLWKPKMKGFTKAHDYIYLFWSHFPKANCSDCQKVREINPSTKNELDKQLFSEVWRREKCLGTCTDKKTKIWMLSAIASCYTRSRTANSRKKKRAEHKRHSSMGKTVIGFPCFVCGEEGHHRHHIVQLQHGGINSLRNIVILCRTDHALIHKISRNLLLHEKEVNKLNQG